MQIYCNAYALCSVIKRMQLARKKEIHCSINLFTLNKNRIKNITLSYCKNNNKKQKTK